jgi:Fe-S-cluster-containing hydrogenase component 2
MSVIINFLKCLKHKEKAVDFGPGKNQAYFCNKIFSVQGDCPVGALRRIPTKEGKVRLEKNQGRCIRCGMCESKKGGREESHVFDSKEKLVKKTWI